MKKLLLLVLVLFSVTLAESNLNLLVTNYEFGQFNRTNSSITDSTRDLSFIIDTEYKNVVLREPGNTKSYSMLNYMITTTAANGTVITYDVMDGLDYERVIIALRSSKMMVINIAKSTVDFYKIEIH